MNTHSILWRTALSLALGSSLWMSGCKHGPPKITTPVTDVQAPMIKSVSRPAVDPKEKQFQEQIDLMQEQIRSLAARTEALARSHGVRMGPKWVEKVQAAREEGSPPADRIRYLEATRALLARKLQALRAEIKVYEEFESSAPTVPRP
jgi:hypothetical protein